MSFFSHSIFSRRSMVAPALSLEKPNFALDTSGVTCVFDGDEAVSAMAVPRIILDR